MFPKQFCMGLVFLLMGSVCLCIADPNEIARDQRLQNLRDRVDAYRDALFDEKTHSVQECEQVIGSLLSDYLQLKPDRAAQLTLEICRLIQSSRIVGKGKSTLIRKYAMGILVHPDKISVDYECQLTRFVSAKGIDLFVSRREGWQALRKEDASVRLHAWKRLVELEELYQNPLTKPIVYQDNRVTPNRSSSGITSGYIFDPNKFVAFFPSIDIHSNSVPRFMRESKLDLRSYSRRFEYDIMFVYAVVPHNDEELAKLLDDYGIDEATKQRILEKDLKEWRQRHGFVVRKPAFSIGQKDGNRKL